MDVAKIGQVAAEREVTVARDAVLAYAAATNDPSPAYAEGVCIPPAYPAVLTWAVMKEAMADFFPKGTHVIHGERDHHLHQVIRPGDTLLARATHFAFAGQGTPRYVMRLDLLQGGQLVAETYTTMVVLGTKDLPSAGPAKPAHEYKPGAGDKRVHRVHADADQTFRYRDASGDTMPVHVDEEAAKRAGLPGMILHGVCTMAMAGHAASTLLTDGDPSRIRRLALRWAKPVQPDTDLDFAFEQLDASRFGFVGTAGAVVFATSGYVELR